jgi:hypothetical protein
MNDVPHVLEPRTAIFLLISPATVVPCGVDAALTFLKMIYYLYLQAVSVLQLVLMAYLRH